jgi:hypothetical protein
MEENYNMVKTFRNKEVNIKERLSMVEANGFVSMVSNNVADVEENIYSPIFYDTALAMACITYYTDLKLPDIDEIYNNLEEYQELILPTASMKFDNIQYFKLIDLIDKKIEFNKQIIIQNNSNNEVTKLVTDLLKEQLETTKLQKKAINETMEMNKKFPKKDIDKIVKVIDHLNKNMKNPAYQKAFVDELVNLKNDETKDGDE